MDASNKKAPSPARQRQYEKYVLPTALKSLSKVDSSWAEQVHEIKSASPTALVAVWADKASEPQWLYAYELNTSMAVTSAVWGLTLYEAGDYRLTVVRRLFQPISLVPFNRGWRVDSFALSKPRQIPQGVWDTLHAGVHPHDAQLLAERDDLMARRETVSDEDLLAVEDRLATVMADLDRRTLERRKARQSVFQRAQEEHAAEARTTGTVQEPSAAATVASVEEVAAVTASSVAAAVEAVFATPSADPFADVSLQNDIDALASLLVEAEEIGGPVIKEVIDTSTNPVAEEPSYTAQPGAMRRAKDRGRTIHRKATIRELDENGRVKPQSFGPTTIGD